MHPTIDFLDRTFGQTGGVLVLVSSILALWGGLLYLIYQMSNGKGLPPGCNNTNTIRMIRPDGRTVVVGQFGVQQWA